MLKKKIIKKLAESLDNLEAEKKSIDKRFRSNSKKASEAQRTSRNYSPPDIESGR